MKKIVIYILSVIAAAFVFDGIAASLWAGSMRLLTGRWSGDFLHVQVNHFVLAWCWCVIPSVIYAVGLLVVMLGQDRETSRDLIKWGKALGIGVGVLLVLAINGARGRIGALEAFLYTLVLVIFILAGTATGYLARAMLNMVNRNNSA